MSGVSLGGLEMLADDTVGTLHNALQHKKIITFFNICHQITILSLKVNI